MYVPLRGRATLAKIRGLDPVTVCNRCGRPLYMNKAKSLRAEFEKSGLPHAPRCKKKMRGSAKVLYESQGNDSHDEPIQFTLEL